MEVTGEKKRRHPGFFAAYVVVLVFLAIGGTAYCFDLKRNAEPSQVEAGVEVGLDGENDIPGAVSREGGSQDNGDDLDISDDEGIPLADPAEK